MEVFRIVHNKWSDKLTASGLPARWNSAGIFMIYTASSRSLACLENVVHMGSLDLVKPFVIMVISIPEYCYCLTLTINTTKPLCIVVIITFSSLKEKFYL